MTLKTAKQATIDWLSILQFGLGCLGIVLAWMLALAQFVASLGELPRLDLLSALIPGMGIFIVGLLLFPSTLLGLSRILGRTPAAFKLRGKLFGFAILIFPLLLALGNLAQDAGRIWPVALLYLSNAILLVAWLLWLALRQLPAGSVQRIWGAFASGLAATPLLAFALEAAGGFILVTLLSIYAGFNPDLGRAIELLSTNPSADRLVQLLAPVLNDPVILFAGLFSLGFAGPLIEELLKPLGVYLLLRRNLSEAQGFALGALCGGGYALFENLTLITIPEAMAVGALGRFGVSAMHIFTAALSGWALARAVKQKRALPLLGILALNIFIHGLWNSLVLLFSAGAVAQASGTGLVPPAFIVVSPLALAFIAMGCVALLRKFNLAFARSQAPKTT
ncbi:MAG: PrsW family glutamic-type intramembrane protease [Anaerolineales bacterium]